MSIRRAFLSLKATLKDTSLWNKQQVKAASSSAEQADNQQGIPSVWRGVWVRDFRPSLPAKRYHTKYGGLRSYSSFHIKPNQLWSGANISNSAVLSNYIRNLVQIHTPAPPLFAKAVGQQEAEQEVSVFITLVLHYNPNSTSSDLKEN